MATSNINGGEGICCWVPDPNPFQNTSQLTGAQNLPDSLMTYLQLSETNLSCSKQATDNVRMHLLHLGWKIKRTKEPKMWRIKYISPQGKTFTSLVQVCLHLTNTKPDDFKPKTKNPKDVGKGIRSVLVVEPQLCPEAVELLYKEEPRAKNMKHVREKARRHLSALGWKFWYTPKNGGFELRYTSPLNKTYISLRMACKGCIDEGGVLPSIPTIPAILSSGVEEFPQFPLPEVEEPCKRRKVDVVDVLDTMPIAISCPKTPERALEKEKPSLQQQEKKRKRTQSVLRSNKRAREVVATNSGHYNPLTILSWLIDNNVVLPRAKVYCKSASHRCKMVRGRINRDGIKCDCCQKVYGISSFEAHGGNRSGIPAANIFLEDGRSLLECQKQMVQETTVEGLMAETKKGSRSSTLPITEDFMCSVCRYGGTLLLCDHCPSAYHLSCIGLENLPQGDWFCPSCRCAVCGQNEFHGNNDQFADRKQLLSCDQCERQFHAGCLRRSGMSKLDFRTKKNWFCSESCENIFIGLHELSGRRIAAARAKLSWTMLKLSTEGSVRDAFDSGRWIEHHSKLNLALALLHQCFEPMKEPLSTDLVKDVLFNKRSVLKRLDFRGFYTVLLEKGDELISVATVRVYGENVAEVPLVATSPQYRRQGMCHILMALLEKKLAELGVKRLFLPAIPQVLKSWTTSFGFSKLEAYERMKFTEYTFLDFQDTTMCEKFLR